MRLAALALLAVFALLAAAPVAFAGSTVVVAATASIQESGLFRTILPKYSAVSGVNVEVLSRASTQALAAAEHDGADIVVVNDPVALGRFVDQGHGVFRRKLMSNDFVIAGPPADPARIGGTRDAPAALRTIAQVRAPYVSRADQSGTHLKEQKLWARAGINPKSRAGNWLRETGLGMGESLDIAGKLGAYILTDRATFVAHHARMKLDVLVEDDPDFFNQYEIVMVAPLRHPGRDAAAAQALLEWLTGRDGQAAIRDFRVEGQQVFFPNSD